MEANFQSDQNIRILQIFNFYRTALALILLISFLTGATTTQLGNYDTSLFLNTVVIYLAFSLLVLFLLKPQKTFTQRQRLLSSLFIIDILAIALMTYSSRGVVSGLGLLHLVTIAAGSILVIGRMSTLLAAIASIATIYGEVYLSFSNQVPANQYIQSGLLGALLFATSLYLQTLAERMRKSAILTQKQATSIVNLEHLNHLIIQRMRTGILVVGADNNIITANDAAQQMLTTGKHRNNKEIPHDNQFSATLPEILGEHLQTWKIDPEKRPPTFSLNKGGPQLQANFAYLHPTADPSVLIFLEDSSQIIQRVRQMKLASLGRLTASIAHEIRNPLGAISHASQLLAEANSLQMADQKLLAIVLKHCERVNLIIEDVLHMSRQKQDSAERINLLDWLNNFVVNYQDTHQLNGKISIEIDPPTTEIRVICSQLEQILNNLFENGLRYSERSTGKANLKLIGGVNGESGFKLPILHIIDDGDGVDPRTEEHLFEPFNTTEASGTGLGLYISKELCEANQAQLSYRRTRKGKSCFSINFSHPDRNID